MFEIQVENPHRVQKGVKAIYLDGERVECIPVQAKNTVHTVRVVMG